MIRCANAVGSVAGRPEMPSRAVHILAVDEPRIRSDIDVGHRYRFRLK
jgi:hypothetical protein